jgi:hypothetical protein|tara:strand:+ start:5559 stop:6212 length:654 start_codon:yes stop_codon:yes gene_type:complete
LAINTLNVGATSARDFTKFIKASSRNLFSNAISIITFNRDNQHMWQIILYVWQICLLRVGPEKIPARWNFLAIFFGFYFLISGFSIITSRPDLNLFSGAVTIFIGSGVAAVAVFGLLSLKQVTNRFVPTMSAIFGTNSIILLPMIVTSAMMELVDAGTLRLLIDAVAWVLLGWWLTIVGSILSRAATISVLQGAMLAFLIEVISLLLTLKIFPLNPQ